MSPETIGVCKCGHCGGNVAVKKNRGGLAYYRCDHCGMEARHHWAKTSDGVLSKFAKCEAANEEKPEKAANIPHQQPAKPAFTTLLGA